MGYKITIFKLLLSLCSITIDQVWVDAAGQGGYY